MMKAHRLGLVWKIICPLSDMWTIIYTLLGQGASEQYLGFRHSRSEFSGKLTIPQALGLRHAVAMIDCA